jgi:multicomponent Na+:H+ antiporter subunit D
MNIHQLQLPVLLVLIPMFTAFVIPIVAIKKKEFAFPIALAALAAMVFVAFETTRRVVLTGPIDYFMGGWEPPWGIALHIDHLSAIMVCLLAVIGFVVGIYSKRSIQSECPDKVVPFYSIYLLLLAGLTGIVVTGDMFNLYVFLEISSLAGYALIAIGDERAPFSTFRYLIIGTAGACFYLLGVVYLYSVTGTLNMADLARILPDIYESKVVLTAFAFFVVGVAIKMALFPLHGWLPDAYTHAPSAVSALIAPTMTKVSAYVMIRVVFTVFEPVLFLETLPVRVILSWVAAAAIIYGSVVAISQSDIKRMLAFSSVSQVGYIVLGLTMASEAGYIGSILHIINHGVMKGCLFAVAGAFIYRAGVRNIEDFGFLNRKMPLTSLAFAIAALSMIGIPPTAGFFSKWYLILGAVDSEQWVFVGVIMASSLLNAAYFFKVIEHMYLKPQRELRAGEKTHDELKIKEAPLSMLIPILALAAGVLVLGFASYWIVNTLIIPGLPSGLV